MKISATERNTLQEGQQNMKVIQIVTIGDVFYGAQKHVLQLSEHLLASGHDVLVLCGTRGPLTERLEAAGVAVREVGAMKHPIRPLQDLRAILDLRRIIRDFKPDVVATHSSKAGIVGRVAAWTCRVPAVFTAHGWSFAEGVPPGQRLVARIGERLCGRISERIIVVAHSEHRLGVSRRIAPPERIECIYYGVEDAAGGPIERRPSASPAHVVMIAGFRPQKDHATLLRALARLTDRPWRLTFLGDGELIDPVRALTRELGLEKRVRFAGAVPDVAPFLRDADMLVLTTNWEGMPISTLEGMCFGLPIVATDVAGASEQVLDGENGILVRRGDVGQVESALRRLLDEPGTRVRFGARSRRLYEEHFTIRRMCEKTEQLYSRIALELSHERADEKSRAPSGPTSPSGGEAGGPTSGGVPRTAEPLARKTCE